jgi:hypothetical protein
MITFNSDKHFGLTDMTEGTGEEYSSRMKVAIKTGFCSLILDTYTNLVRGTPVEKLNHHNETMNGCVSHICVCFGM